MDTSQQKVLQYLDEAHASEIALIAVLQSQIAMTPRGRYRSGLERHLDETRDHARRIQERMVELGHGRSALQTLVGASRSVVGVGLALGKTPFDLLRGTGGEEKVLKNAKDAASTEALEIATYTAIERLATQVDDKATARLAASIRADEERMLQLILKEIPRLTDAVVGAEVDGDPSYSLDETGAADAARAGGRKAKQAASGGAAKVKRTARQARKVPGVAQAEGQVKGAVASASDLPLARYDSLTAAEITEKLPSLSQIDLAKIDSYERKHENRTTVLSRITSLRTREPWPGYDELNASEIRAVLGEGDDRRNREVASYERAHKGRAAVLNATERERANA